SLEQILPPLLSGACVILASKAVWSLTEFHAKAQSFGLTVVNLPTAYWSQLAQELRNEPNLLWRHQLKLVIVGGDRLVAEHLPCWMPTLMDGGRLLNAYGPTEAIVTTTVFEVPRRSRNEGPLEIIPIGRPLANRTIYILDSHGNPVPI